MFMKSEGYVTDVMQTYINKDRYQADVDEAPP